MAEILGLGCTHWPTLCLPNDGLTGVFKRVLDAPNVDPAVKDPANWPSELLAELGNDDGLSAANRCGERFGNDFRAIRKILDDFNPDLVVIWGDDQYENFREDIVPAFCLLGYDSDFQLKPWANGNGGKPNRWDERGDWALKLHGHREAAKYLATGLIERVIDMVACVPVAEERLFVARPRRRPATVRCGVAGRLQHLAETLARRDGIFRPARDAQLDDADRRNGSSRPPSGNSGLHGNLHPGVGQMLPVLPAVNAPVEPA